MEQIWWERVPNAMAFVSDVASDLLNEKSLILQYSSDIPWYTSMVNAVKSAVRQKNSSKSFEVIRNVDDPGVYLLREYCKPEKRASYRPAKSYAKFIAESDDIVIHDRYFWVQIQSAKNLEDWTSFVSDYLKERQKEKATAVFIIEWQDEKNVKAKKGIRIRNFDDYISTYDRIVFAMLAASSLTETPFIKSYLSELASSVLKNDIELCAECMCQYHAFLKAPFATINHIMTSNVRSDGREYSFSKSEETVKHNIWQAQIKTVYPVLEEFREAFVKKHRSAIQNELPISSSTGEKYTDPEDVELGTLVYMAGSGKLSLKTKEYEELVRYREARNNLSHLNTLSLEEIQELNIC